MSGTDGAFTQALRHYFGDDGGGRKHLLHARLQSDECRQVSRLHGCARWLLGTFKTRGAAEKHERAVQFFKHG